MQQPNLPSLTANDELKEPNEPYGIKTTESDSTLAKSLSELRSVLDTEKVTIQEERELLKKKADELNAREEELKERENEIDTRQSLLDIRERDLANQEEAFKKKQGANKKILNKPPKPPKKPANHELHSPWYFYYLIFTLGVFEISTGYYNVATNLIIETMSNETNYNWSEDSKSTYISIVISFFFLGFCLSTVTFSMWAAFSPKKM